MERVLLAVDGSDHSWRAARLAGDLSRAFGAEIDVLHVVEHAPVVPRDVLAEYERIEHVQVTRNGLLAAIGAGVVTRGAALAREAGGVVRKEEVVEGNPASEIVEHADEIAADVIVMGRRGLGGARGLLLGSVSHKVGHLTGRTLVTTE